MSKGYCNHLLNKQKKSYNSTPDVKEVEKKQIPKEVKIKKEKNPNWKEDFKQKCRESWEDSEVRDKRISSLKKAMTPELIQHLREINLGEKNPMYGKRATLEERQLQSKRSMGEKNNNWRGGKKS